MPATLAGFADRAVFDLYVNEERLGAASSTWTAGGRIDAHSALSLAGQRGETTVRVTPDATGRWAEIVVHAPDALRTSTRHGTTVTRVARVAHAPQRAQTSAFEIPDDALLFDNDAPALASHAVRAYDRARGGPQSFPLSLGGRPPVTLIMEATERSVAPLGGRDVAVTRFTFSLPGAELLVWADEDGRTLMVEMPAQRVAYVREGCATLRRREAADPLLSAATHDVTVEREVPVPMRDGVALATDVYRPADVDRAPVILARTPYSKAVLELYARYYARRGYVFAAQDCRGCFASPGAFQPFLHEGDDGYDAIEWLAARDYANGRVGMIGPSYLGLAQWLAAARRPPHLVTIVPNVSPSDPFAGIPYERGVFHLYGMLWWAEILASRAGADITGVTLARVSQRRRLAQLRSLPVVDLDVAVMGAESAIWRAWIAHPIDDDYWAPARFLHALGEVRLPVFHQSGWYDDNGIGTKRNYAAMAAHGHPHQKLTLGPWGHTDTATRTYGERDFGEAAIVDLQREYLRWFDRWLKEIENGIDREPLVSVFLMGANRWLHGDAYPLPGATFRKLHLVSGGHANTSLGDGRLQFDAPPADSPPDRYTYDPGDPTPAARLYEEPEEDARRVRSDEERVAAVHAYRRELAESRRDVLIYETEPLGTPLAFAGPLSMELYASTSARDTDWVVTVSEVAPDGRVFRLTQGAGRARFRDSTAAPMLVEPGAVVRYVIDCWHSAVELPAGARLRVEVASAAFPLYSRNLGTGEHDEAGTEWVVAEQTVYHDATRPSHLLLPVVPV